MASLLPLPYSHLEWYCQHFTDLHTADWYNISQAREQVFIVEQNCAYLDADGQDLQAYHLFCTANFDNSNIADANFKISTGDTTPLITQNKKLACYARILPPALHFPTGEFAMPMPAIGRVLTVAAFRGHGLAKQLMVKAIAQTHHLYGKLPIYISAQVYLLPFYIGLGFIPQGQAYLEDNISHQDMVLPFIEITVDL